MHVAALFLMTELKRGSWPGCKLMVQGIASYSHDQCEAISIGERQRGRHQYKYIAVSYFLKINLKNLI